MLIRERLVSGFVERGGIFTLDPSVLFAFFLLQEYLLCVRKKDL